MYELLRLLLLLSFIAGARGAEDQQGETEMAEADGVPVQHQVPQQPARPAARAALSGGAFGPG